MDRPQHQVDIAAAPIERIGLAARADRHRKNRALAHEAAVLPSLLARVALAISEHTVEPALHHRRRHVPPHRILQDDEIGFVQPREFVGHRPRQGSPRAGVALFGLNVETIGRDAIGKVRGNLKRIEPHRVQIGGRGRPARAFERGRPQPDEMRVEGLGLGMGENEMGAHEGLVWRWATLSAHRRAVTPRAFRRPGRTPRAARHVHASREATPPAPIRPGTERHNRPAASP